MTHTLKILMTVFVTHDVKHFIVEKPEHYQFTPGQATEVSINQDGWQDKKRPFTFTSLNEDLALEFTIKSYPEHDGVTKKLHTLKPGNELILDDPWGTINYKGPGTFIAGGAGITPFIAILRDLQAKGEAKNNSLIFSNKTKVDIILEPEWKNMFKDNPENLILTLTNESAEGYENRRIDENFLKEKISDFSQNFYVCGPPAMVQDITQALKNLGAKPDTVVIES